MERTSFQRIALHISEVPEPDIFPEASCFERRFFCPEIRRDNISN